MISYVQRYIDLGFVIHPCCPAEHYCQSPGKIPYDPYHGRHMSGWQTHGQFSLEQWQEWIDLDSSINIGFLCGAPSDLLCLDIDEDEGMKVLEKFDIPWRDTWQYRTGRGLRVLFRHRGPGPTGLLTADNHSVEVLGDGRQSILPPSVHPNGSSYEWVVGNSPKDCGLSSETGWADRIGGQNGELDDLSLEDTDWKAVLDRPPAPGARNETLVKVAGHLLAPGGMAPKEAEFWLSLYNSHCLPEPIGGRELSAILRSVAKMEQRTRDTGEREIRRIMAEYGVKWDDAKTMWEGMQ
jgi:hypothetical protein